MNFIFCRPRHSYYSYRFPLLVTVAIAIIYLSLLAFPTTERRKKRTCDFTIIINEKRIHYSKKKLLTATGNTPYIEIEECVYKKFGYKTVTYKEPFAVVEQMEPKNCDQVFEAWLDVANFYNYNQTPPVRIPIELEDKFTLNGHTYVKSYYFDERPVKFGDRQWPREYVEKFVNAKAITCEPYPGEGEAIYYATKFYNISGMNGMVVGSIDPWVEAFCIKNGANKLLTLEYDKIITNHEKLSHLYPSELAKRWKQYEGKFDFVATFSSIEHSGLGRYGDPIDPNGDIREMQKIRCLLKNGGLVFLGLPTGKDGIYFNAHRIYGRLRLPIMFDGFELLNVFYGTNKEPTVLETSYFSGRNAAQHVFVLKKRSR